MKFKFALLYLDSVRKMYSIEYKQPSICQVVLEITNSILRTTYHFCTLVILQRVCEALT